MTPLEQVRRDLEHYGFVPDRLAALAEQFPGIETILSEHPTHPKQRAIFDARRAAFASPPPIDDVSAWQEVEADRLITSQLAAQHRIGDVKPDGSPVDIDYLAHEAVANLRARYGGPSTFKENQ